MVLWSNMVEALFFLSIWSQVLVELKADKVISAVLWRMCVYCSHNYSCEHIIFRDTIIQTQDFISGFHFFIATEYLVSPLMNSCLHIFNYTCIIDIILHKASVYEYMYYFCTGDNVRDCIFDKNLQLFPGLLCYFHIICITCTDIALIR